MNKQFQDECSFVSLRDVQRALLVMAWFYEQAENNGVLFEMMNTRLSNKYTFEAQNSEDGDYHANVVRTHFIVFTHFFSNHSYVVVSF